MLNQTLLVGRIVETPKINKTKNENDFSSITLAVPRDYPNKDGVYEADFIDLIAFDKKQLNKMEHLLKGDLVIVNASLSTRWGEKEGQKTKYTDIKINNIDFLKSSKNQEKTMANDEMEEEIDK